MFICVKCVPAEFSHPLKIIIHVAVGIFNIQDAMNIHLMSLFSKSSHSLNMFMHQSYSQAVYCNEIANASHVFYMCNTCVIMCSVS